MVLNANAARDFRPDGSTYVSAAPESPYFTDEQGEAWTPIGQNDAITWPELNGLFRRKDMAAAEQYLQYLAEHGVTCLRLMLEYSQTGHRYFERRAGEYNPDLVRLWDDLFARLRRYKLRVLLTPYDTFWMWVKWKHHPYNRARGGPCAERSQLVLCPETRDLIRRRLQFAAQRWGEDGTIFAWDLWNEIHPSHAGDAAAPIFDFVQDLSDTVREAEQRAHGRTHLQTVSIFGPALHLDPLLSEIVYRHPALDFVNVHLYEEKTIDCPRNTVDAAISAGRLMAEAVGEAGPNRPVFDSEHGPIHLFHDKKKTLPEAFDDEYFRHVQWAHLASGGAGGGMRWPNRRPHSLTSGMRKAQKLLADFLPLIDWRHFRRVNRNEDVRVNRKRVSVFACADDSQAVIYLLRRDSIARDGTLDATARPVQCEVRVPGLRPGGYRVHAFDPVAQGSISHNAVAHFSSDDDLRFTTPPFSGEIAFALRRVSDPAF